VITSRDTKVRRMLRRVDLTAAEANAVAATLDGTESFLNPEEFFLDSQALCHGGVSLAAGAAGNRSIIQLRNRSTVAGEPAIVVVNQVVLWAIPAVNVVAQLGYNHQTLGAGASSSGNGIYRDLQWLDPGRVNAAIIQTSRAAVIEFNNTIPYGAQGSGPYAEFIIANGAGPLGPFTLGNKDDPVAVLPPPYALQVFPSVDAQAITAYFRYRELYLRHR